MILADTSAWVEFDRATSSRVDQRITQLISDDGPLAVTQPVIMEIVAAARSDGRKSELRRLLGRFTLLNLMPLSISTRLRRSTDDAVESVSTPGEWSTA